MKPVAQKNKFYAQTITQNNQNMHSSILNSLSINPKTDHFASITNENAVQTRKQNNKCAFVVGHVTHVTEPL